MSHPLDGFGFLVADGEPLRVLGTVFESSIWPGRAPEGHVLLRCMFGGARDPEAIELGSPELVAAARRDLREALGIDSEPVHESVVVWPRAIAQYTRGHLGRVERAEALAEPLGVFLGGSSYHGVSVNRCVADSQRVAGKVLAHLSRSSAALLVFLAVALSWGCSGMSGSSARATRDGGEKPIEVAKPVAGADEDAAAATAPGSITLSVVWDPAPASALSSPGRNHCGVERRPGLRVHPLGGVRDAVAILSGPGASSESTAADLTVRDCRAEPVVAVGARVNVTSADERRHRVVVEPLKEDGEAGEPIAEIELPLVGQSYQLAPPGPGIVRVRTETDGGDPSYLIVPGERLVSLTDNRGRVRLGDLAPGSYELIVWHRPVRPNGPPIVRRSQVVVEAGKRVRHTVSLAPE